MGTRWNRLGEAVLTSTQNLCFEQKYEKYQHFKISLSVFWVVKISIYLNKCVFVIQKEGTNRHLMGSEQPKKGKFFPY